MTDGDWRTLRLKRDGMCTDCGAALTAGTSALWSRSRSAVRCATHEAAPVSAPDADQTTGDAEGEWRLLKLRRPAQCSACGSSLGAGTSAQWNPQRRVVRCASHDSPPEAPAQTQPAASPPVAPRSTGTAGGSAQAEYARRKARHDKKVRDAHPILGGLILALSDEPQHVRAWQTGAVGERAVARRLDQLVEQGHAVEVMHDRRIPGTKANIDHIAVSSSGVHVIDAKNYTGMVRVDWEGGLFSPRRYKLLVGRRDATKLVTGVQRQVDLVGQALAGTPGLPDDVPVTGVLAFFDAEWPLLFPPDEIDGVRLEGPKSTTRLILRAGPYSPGRITAIAEGLRTAFPSA